MNSIFLSLGPVTIYWYSVIIFIALLIGGTLALKESKKFNILEDIFINMFFYLIPIAIIGARLYFVAFHWDYYSQNILDIIKIWEGGLAIHGAIIFGFIWILIYTKIHHIQTMRMFDIVVVSLILGQAIGRWGNFMNQEAFGPETSFTFLSSLHIPKFIIDGMLINGTYYQPTFLYESIWCLIGFIILLLWRKRSYTKLGTTTMLYLIWYGIGRFMIESLRTDSLMLGSLKMAQIISILFIVIGIIGFIMLNKGSKFDNLYNPEKGKVTHV